MEAVEQTGAPPAGLNNNDLTPIAKGKRTKRHRTHSPTHFTTRPPSVPALANNHHVPTSPASSSAGNSTTTEEEDTARCLILLAQGRFPSNNHTRSSHDYQYRQVSDRKAYSQTTGNTNTTKTACIYTCKTCSRSFSSFQALGGHRASHKKPKNEKRSAFFSDEEDFPSPSSVSSFKNRISSSSLSLQLNISNTNSNYSAIPKSAAPSPRIHECSYCGAEFNSGQALGGHMRRHRGGPISPPVIPTSAAPASPRNVLSLDLNLPAPEDENPRLGLSGPRQQNKNPEERKPNEAAGERVNDLPTSSSAPSMVVDCHY